MNDNTVKNDNLTVAEVDNGKMPAAAPDATGMQINNIRCYPVYADDNGVEPSDIRLIRYNRKNHVPKWLFYGIVAVVGALPVILVLIGLIKNG